MNITENQNEIVELKPETYPCGALSCMKMIILKAEEKPIYYRSP